MPLFAGLIMASTARGQELKLVTDPAAEATVQEAEVSWDDLGVNPGLLSTNPFYFIKEIRRNTLRRFSFGIVNRIETELNILSEQAAELKLQEEINTDYETGLRQPLERYQNTLRNIDVLLPSLPNIPAHQDTWDMLVRTYLVHIRLLESLRGDDLRLDEKIMSVEDIWSALVADHAVAGHGVEFLQHWTSALNKSRDFFFSGLLSAETMDRLITVTQNITDRDALLSVQEQATMRFLAAIELRGEEADWSEAVPLLNGEPARRIAALDSAREYASGEAKNNLGVIRQNLLTQFFEKKLIGKKEAERTLSTAQSLLSELNAEATSTRQLIQEQLNRAHFNINQSQEAFDVGQYGLSFSQASLAVAGMKKVVVQLPVLASEKDHIDGELQALKMRFDALPETPAGDSEDITAAAEKALAASSDLVVKGIRNAPQVMSALLQSKLLVAKAEVAAE